MRNPDGALVDSLVAMITERRKGRLVYRRQADEVTTIHEVAPLDIIPGTTSKTKHILYLLAWCFAEDRPEVHLVTRIERVITLGDHFNYATLKRRWPAKWPPPETWVVPRDWN